MKKVKKIISLTIATVMLVASMDTNVAFANEMMTEIELTESVPIANAENEFVIDENGVLTKYCGEGGDVVIPDGVTSIGDSAFFGCSSLKSVVIPDGVTSIGSGAFNFCSSLSSVVIPDGVTSIGTAAFFNCASLYSVSIPESVTSIEIMAFGRLSGFFDENLGFWVEDTVWGFTISGYPDTEAEKYAKENYFNFIALDPSPSPTVTPIITPEPSKIVSPTLTPKPTTELKNIPNLKSQKITVSSKASKTVNYKAASLKKKKVSFSIAAKAKTAISYKVTKGSRKYISVSAKGKVTLKKGCKKGTYKVTVTAKKTSKYKKATRVITIRVR